MIYDFEGFLVAIDPDVERLVGDQRTIRIDRFGAELCVGTTLI